ncbi:MAG TPA: tRNA pseudouridine(55) synthase TruB [Candidatus Omnitrophota bacterium]|jgi:tRNA pseudouridine55 synthase|nr:tRNA pseudouridine(55) synthase TruB [Candidatus Omnitrophota bacterium]
MKDESPYNGIIVVNKPSGMTSHDVVSRVRRILKMKRVGHAGTLDPLATGVLIILLGRCTKLFKEFEAYDKGYKASMILGTKTTTADIEGKILKQIGYDQVTREQFENIMKGFRGNIVQVPPMVSAIKVNGKRLYELARKGIEVKREPRAITIRDLQLVDFSPPRVTFHVECSKGTYVRQLAEDMAERLNNIACISEIERTRVGPFRIDEAVALEDLGPEHVKLWNGTAR